MGALWTEYYRWMLDKISCANGSFNNDHTLLLRYLSEQPFRYEYILDQNRYDDGISLRSLFASEKGYSHALVNKEFEGMPCSILEMMIALAMKMEVEVFADGELDDRTGMWFWKMVRSLGIFHETNDRFSQEYVTNILNIFAHHAYSPNGHGGLFTIEDPTKDMRRYDIWYQVSMYALEQRRNK